MEIIDHSNRVPITNAKEPDQLKKLVLTEVDEDLSPPKQGFVSEMVD
jgi:hypothetical protein